MIVLGNSFREYYTYIVGSKGNRFREYYRWYCIVGLSRNTIDGSVGSSYREYFKL
jgi:hypothetical protein